MSDQELRRVERAWLNQPEDEALLRRFVAELVRHGRDPVTGLADARPDAPWAGFLHASLPIADELWYGRRLHAFLHNGTFFYTSVDVYADGKIEAWEITDRAGLSTLDVPVRTRAAAGEEVRITSLGGGAVLDSRWRTTEADLLRAVDLLLVALEPLRTEDIAPRPATLFGGDIYRRGEDGQLILARETPVLARESGVLTIRPWVIYADGRCRLGARGALRDLDETIDALVAETTLTTRPAEPRCWIDFPGLGRALIKSEDSWSWYIDPRERGREARDLLQQLQGGPGALQACRAALADYRSALDDAFARARARESLRLAYEAIPEHLRLYVGDMDTKDYEVRRILYPEELEDIG